MASVSCDPNGNRTVQFVGSDKRRRSVRLGKATAKVAESMRQLVEHLVNAKLLPDLPLPSDVARSLAKMDSKLYGRLEAVGLVAGRTVVNVPKIGPFLAEFLASRKGAAKPDTLVFYGHTQRNMLDCFGPDKRLTDFTEADAETFRLHLVKEELSAATIARRCGLAKSFLRHAVKKRIIERNPFAELKGTVRGNRDRQHFVSRDDTDRIIDKCPDACWRLLVALARYGGVRTPSESLTLKWDDIDWANDRIRITSPKTEHHEGKGSRIIPLFPELRPFLLESQELAPRGAVYCIQRYKISDCWSQTLGWRSVNLRTTFAKIIKRAGLKPWPRLWHALRASRQTELAASFPIHVVCQWLGNSRLIAQEHYLLTTDADFHKAVSMPTGKAVHIAVQQASARSGTAPHPAPENEVDPRKRRIPVGSRGLRMGDEGFEPPTLTV